MISLMILGFQYGHLWVFGQVMNVDQIYLLGYVNYRKTYLFINSELMLSQVVLSFQVCFRYVFHLYFVDVNCSYIMPARIGISLQHRVDSSVVLGYRKISHLTVLSNHQICNTFS